MVEAAPRVVRVLLVEDNPHVAELIREGLIGAAKRELKGKLTFEFETLSDGRAALDRCSMDGAGIDLVICDVYMPVMDGAMFLTQLRAKRPGGKPPVIALSAGGPSAKEAALAAGADLFLDKPIRLAEVLDAISKVLSH
jgi:CheY-like chemotaxis protein